MAKKYYKSKKCLNCDYPVNNANYCPQCGQINNDKRLPFMQLVKDIVGEYFTLDSRFFRSFIPLLSKPGQLTHEYNEGKRANYIFPLRLYMFMTFLFFLILTVQNKISSPDLEEKKQESITALDSLENLLNTYPIEDQKEIISKIDSAYVLKLKTKDPHIVIGGTPSDSLEPGFGKYLADKLLDISRRGKEGWRSLWMELLNQSPKMMFLLLPVFALLLKLVYIRRKILYINHLIFSLHIHTVLFLYLIIANLLPTWYIILLTVIGAWFHLFFAVRKVYQQSKWKTFFKLNLVLFIYHSILAFGFALLFIFAAISV